jgi:UPF0716 protein FxsA
MWLFALFIAIPLIEIALFIQVGGAIGLWPTLLVVIVTAMLGSWLVRSQGAAEMSRLRQSFAQLDDPTENLAHGAMILFSGALLLTPGFFTDAVGFALLVPDVRTRVFQWLRTKVQVQSFTMGAVHMDQTRDDIIDGEFQDITSEQKPTHHPSGWTRH